MNRQTDNDCKTVTQGRTLYSVIRYVPNILREEFVNVGVLVVSPGQNWHGLRALSSFGEGSRVKLLPGGDGAFVRHAVKALSGALTRYSEYEWTEERFRDFTVAYAANNLQLTAPRPAAVSDAAGLLQMLFTQLVEDVRAERTAPQRGRTVIRDEVRSVFNQSGLFRLGLKEDYILPVRSEPVVDLAYQNGVWHCYQAVAFDVDRRKASSQVNAFRQTVTDARRADDPLLAQGRFTVFTNNRGDNELRDDLLGLLQEESIEVLDVRDALTEASKIAHDLRSHDLIPRPQA
ncbi:hypothetical protein GCM10008959_33110 [Deinococcus seoulensis]|uniref:DUF3037 domain-containing protein n=1 Tax=Deinococcus seoulensis TaxID=1837379 RepID=A0ABQ2RUV2_9DEIO|nr:DUF3037 domain-containing protein [Deinococcus seoulensis]GGR68366.1 hypothetical protein GCM10008959_33110 [Deinococcus seoulensis]